MLKSVVLFVLVWHEMCQFYSQANQDLLPDTLSPKINETDGQMKKTVIYNFNVSHQTLYVNGPLLRKLGFDRNSNVIDSIHRTDYVVTGTDAHKLHRRAVSWSKARRICVEEGGHLAVIRSEEEEQIVLKMMSDLSVSHAWVGYHDQFDEGDWVSVFDEPLDESGWERWSKHLTPNPDNYCGKENCAHLVRDGGGMNDLDCNRAQMFICKRSAL